MSERFNILSTRLAGLKVIERLPLSDTRGAFERIFCDTTFALLGFDAQVRQINRSSTRQRGSVRGLHYQAPPHAEDKLVSCLRGEVFDVAVDLRQGSPTFLHWHGEMLSDGNHRSLFIPKGFAHGFQTMIDDCELVYVHSAPHAPEAERGLLYTDPGIGIPWPLPPIALSQRDSTWPEIERDFAGLVL